MSATGEADAKTESRVKLLVNADLERIDASEVSCQVWSQGRRSYPQFDFTLHSFVVTILSKIRRISFRNPLVHLILRGTRCESIKEIKAKSIKPLMPIPEQDYLASFEDRKKRGFLSGGENFEGNKIDFKEQIRIFILQTKYGNPI